MAQNRGATFLRDYPDTQAPLSLLGCFSLAGLRLPLRGVLRQRLRARFAVPLLEGLGRNFALDEQLSELAALRLAFERHPVTLVGSSLPPHVLSLLVLAKADELRVPQMILARP